MATALVRDLDDAVYERLKARAAGNNRSLEAELREILVSGLEAGRYGHGPGGGRCNAAAAGGPAAQRQRGDPRRGTPSVSGLPLFESPGCAGGISRAADSIGRNANRARNAHHPHVGRGGGTRSARRS